MPRQYITSIKLPTDTAIYYIKDTEAREAIAQMGNFTKYLGMATTMPTNANVTIEYINPETGQPETEQKVAVAGDVISLKTATITPPGYSQKEYIFDGTNWAELNTMQGLLKNFAYVSVGYGDVPNLVKSGTVTVSSTNLAATAVPITFSTTAVTGATKVVTGVTSKSITYAYDVSSASGTLGTVATKKLKVSVPKDTWITGVNYSKATAATATGGAATVGSTTVYGVQGSTTKYVTGLTSSSTGGFVGYMSVTGTQPNGILTFYGIDVDTANAKAYTVGKSGATTFTQPTVTITNTNTAGTLTKVASTTLALVEDSTGTEVVTSVPASVTVNVSLSTSTANVLSTITSGYGKVSAYAGGSHTHGVSDTIAITQSGTTAISVYPGEHP